MRRLLGWLGAALGGLALYRLLTRRPPPEREELREPSERDARAGELRRKLEESRELVGEREAFEEAETSVDRADPEADPEERRKGVHERGRAAAEEMKRAEPG